ncbi:MAG: YihY/virulence factor BrkB family protein [Anaerolineae bacterium]|jgi:membrane protein
MSEPRYWDRVINTFRDLAARAERFARNAYRRANDHTGGAVGIVRRSIKRFGDARGSEAAAGMAYYALFSLFPLTLLLVFVGSFFLAQEQALQRVVSLLEGAIPVSADLIRQNIEQVLAIRGPLGLVGLIGTFWSASGVFAILTHHVNQAWPGAEERNVVERRLLAISIVGILVVLLVLSLASTAFFNYLARSRSEFASRLINYRATLWPILSILVPWFFTFLLFLAIYRWIPNTDVPWSAAFWAALVVASLWQIAANAFTWYVGSGLANYRLVYGSLGTIIALIFWIYLAGWVTIFGAHLSASVARARGGAM